jgi:Do/DeqQ family serine protease
MKVSRSTKLLIGLVGACCLLAGLIIASSFNWPSRIRASSTPETAGALNPGEQSPFTSIAQAVIPAVVNIAAERTEQLGSQWQSPFNDWFREFFRGFPHPQIPQEQKTQVLGSGIIIDKSGLILTAGHVVKDADRIVVTLADKTIYKGRQVKILGRDSRTDIAVIKVDADHDLPFARLGNSDAVSVGDWAIAIGNPFMDLQGTVTVGVISAKGRSGIELDEGPSIQDFLQTDASINPGNSGGPLLNIRGEVIGINDAIASPVRVNVGIGFAVPINIAKSVYPQLVEKGKVTRGYLGINIRELTPDLAEGFGLGSAEGVVVDEVRSGTPAEKAGMKAGDVILRYEGKKVATPNQLQLLVADTPLGKQADVVVFRDRKEVTLRVKIAEMPGEEVAQAEPEAQEEQAWLGMKVASATGSAAEAYRLQDREGVLVVNVEAGSPAYDAGIRPGDLVKKIGSRAISSLRDYSDARRSLQKERKAMVFQVRRGDRTTFIAVKPEP